MADSSGTADEKQSQRHDGRCLFLYLSLILKTYINKTKNKVIVTALEDLIRKSKISGLKEFKGKVDLDIDMNAMRGRQ